MDYATLIDELDTDPLGRGYASMTDAEAAADLNAPLRTAQRERITGADIFNALDPAEFQALLPDVQQRVRDVFSLGDGIDVRGGKNARNVLLAAFGAGTTTRANLAALVQRPISRAQELGLPPVGDGHVKSAREQMGG